jgi:hypothetical protein
VDGIGRERLWDTFQTQDLTSAAGSDVAMSAMRAELRSALGAGVTRDYQTSARRLMEPAPPGEVARSGE